MSPGPGRHFGVVPVRARELAVQLGVLFESDRELAGRLNEAQHRLQRANSRLWSGLHPDALALLYENTDRLAIRQGASVIVGLIIDAIRSGGDEEDVETAVLPALQQAHWTIHRAFVEYQSVCEERRQLAATVGEVAQQLTEALTAAGWTREAAQNADVRRLAGS